MARDSSFSDIVLLLMPNAPHIAARNAAVFALGALALAAIVALVFETGQTPIANAIGLTLPSVVLLGLPLLFIAIALSRGPSRSALALGVAYPVVMLVGLWLALSIRYASGNDGAMTVTFLFLFFWVSKTWMVLLFLFIPALVRLLIVSWRPYRGMPGRRAAPLLAWTTALALALAIAAVPVMSVASEVPEYRIDVVDNAIEPINECLWRLAGAGAERGFPDSLSAIRGANYHPLQHSGNKFPNRCEEQADRLARYPFRTEYVPAARDADGRTHAFTLRLIEKTRAGGRPRVVWIDETGLRRQAVTGPNGKLDSIRTAFSSSLRTLLIIQHAVDAYASTHGGVYPAVIVPDHEYRDGETSPDSVLALPVGPCSSFEQVGASCVEFRDRNVVYEPAPTSAETRMAYTLTVQPATYYDNVMQQPIASRTHRRDAAGGLHAFGGWRAATDQDPTPPADELADAREAVRSYLEQRNRDSITAEYSRRQQDSVWGKRRGSRDSRTP